MADTVDSSTIERITYGKREARSVILTADNLSVCENTHTGELCITLHRYNDATRKAVESYEFRLCAEDRGRLKAFL